MNKYFWLLFAGVILIGGALFFNQKKPSTKQESISKSASTSDQIKEFSMVARKWQFDPPTINVKQGDKVRLKIKSIDVTHGFNLPAFNINKTIEPEKEFLVEFIADQKGEFVFFCSIYCGQGHQGMKGKLIVE